MRSGDPTRRPLRWIALAIAGVACTAPPLAAWWLSGFVVHPPWYQWRTPEQGLAPGRFTDPASDFGLDYADVSFPTLGGSTLRGWFVPSGQSGRARATVVAVHGGGGDRRGLLDLLPALHAAGHPVLLFDCREQGISDGSGRGIGLGAREWQDVVSAVDWLEGERGIEDVALVGHSQGGAASILAAAQDPRIDAVVAEGTGVDLVGVLAGHEALAWAPRWFLGLVVRGAYARIDAPWSHIVGLRSAVLDLVGRVSPRPLLLIHGGADAMVPVEQARALHAAAREPVELWIVEGAGHVDLRRHAGAAYADRVLMFLEAAFAER